ncbi:MAG: 3'-5' exoribonuclease [Desulfurellales bacterium]|nr:MAG: 3'-5' exoribonuclease [Desulfurellales bacterium]
MPSNVMIDIETLGHQKDVPFISSIGAVKFDPLSDTISDPFFINLNATGNGELDYSTVKWWMHQMPDAQQAQFKNAVPVKQALRELAAYVEGATYIWANGINFDIGLLDKLYKANNMPRPWGFRHMDMRSLWLVCRGLGFNQERLPTGQEHNALDDAMRQATDVQDMVRFLKGKQSV